ncbi:glucan 1,4-alpha-glucosidase [Lichenihabitans psoromatis]|uniref:glucan 1,4-alpha-glucosidase n=1 Tax=Lichenihabitans psoromatis TaxID=2528642 RepID=UPI001038320A|nr:glucan 1,4-alpha-glucosidase [Lichenihabitans psoromatis]
MTDSRDAPGHPGIQPRWTSSAKTGVGAAIQGVSRVSFTVSHGILNEIYFPRPDEACLRDLGLIVTDGTHYFSEEKRATDSEVWQIAPGVPGYIVTNRSRDGRYVIEKRIIADPERDVVLQQIRFQALVGSNADYRIFALAAPHLVNAGAHNTGTVDSVKGWPMLFAEGKGLTMALAASTRFRALSVGFVQESDGHTILSQNFVLNDGYTRAADGNVALTGELDFRDTDTVVLAVAFGRDKSEAGFRARSSIMDGYALAEASYVEAWQAWQKSLVPLDRTDPKNLGYDPYRVSTAVLRTHESKSFAGGMIASLSIPWGFSKGDGDLGGYHLVWPRDLVESATALLAIGAHQEARRVLTYLQATQEDDGHWPQNMWLDGLAYWNGIQMDETAFPIILVDMAEREGALLEGDFDRFWPMVRHAARYIILNGPVTGQDRWEEDGGYSPFTLAVEIAALVVAADIAERLGHKEDAGYLLDTADLWNDSIERWTYATKTPLAEAAGVAGYYVRISPAGTPESERPVSGSIDIKNVPEAQMRQVASEVISPDALALVRFGLRAADDPRILDTVKVIDKLLKVDLPQGPLWHRYNSDGYGEHADGSPFDGTGIGRAWPLMAGERAHYELALGNVAEARRLLETVEKSANDSGFLPEQSWDSDDIPHRELFKGKPAGSAMPLVWAHGEHVKLLRSLRDGKIFDMPAQVAKRYSDGKRRSTLRVWRFNSRATKIDVGMKLRLSLLAAARVHWSIDGWATVHDTDTWATSFHLHVAILDVSAVPVGGWVDFTFYWTDAKHWEGTDFAIEVVQPTDDF